MGDFAYRQGSLHAEAVPIETIAASVGTPFYCYSRAGIERRYLAYAAAFAGQDARICYALKANSNLAVIATLARLGAGADVVSEGELRRALAGGVPPDRIVFSGVGKQADELGFALDQGIAQINVESEPELDLLSRVAAARGVTAAVAIRVNPDVDARTHAKISTGMKENKFGIDIGVARRVFAHAAELPGIRPVAVAMHIGSQITTLHPYEEAFGKLAELVRELRSDGLTISHVDLGGGVGVAYRDEATLDLDAYAAMIRRVIGPLDVGVTLEPGRVLVAEAGVLVAKVLYVKPGTTRSFVVQDAAMNDLIRPTLYEAYHEVVPVRQPEPGPESGNAGHNQPVFDVVGPICESGDYLGLDRSLPPLGEGDLIAIRTAGAYGAVMSSTYNSRLLVPEVMVSGTEFAVIRPRQTYEDLLGLDRMPSWL
ncbi:MAG TPA: diaminopimelate decarboxylase [Stellaceae bacterium]|nr:diaminopimelate decarboxylase [Stellaceae bacterium]